MSEMIGNFFFLNHSYDRAVPILEKVISDQPSHERARKKLVIAYVENGRLRDSYRLFSEIMEQNPEIITDTDPIAEDCPCPDLLDNIVKGRRNFDDPANRLLVLGIYAAYCCVSESIMYFQEYMKLFPNDQRAATIIRKLQLKLGTEHE